MKTLLTFLLLPVTMKAAVTTYRVTIGASATQVSSTPVNCRWVVFQNNAANSIRIGDSSVSSTRGILLASGTPGGSFFVPPIDPAQGKSYLQNWYIAGTQNDVIDVVCDVI